MMSSRELDATEKAPSLESNPSIACNQQLIIYVRAACRQVLHTPPHPQSGEAASVLRRFSERPHHRLLCILLPRGE